jgi:hypothetical protein
VILQQVTEPIIVDLDLLNGSYRGYFQFYPGQGSAAGLELIAQTRAYLHNFTEATKSGDAKSAEQRLLPKYPQYHVKQFLSVFRILAYFPAAVCRQNSFALRNHGL